LQRAIAETQLNSINNSLRVRRVEKRPFDARRLQLWRAVGGINYCHYAHRAPLTFNAIMTLPQPTDFSALVRAFDAECPCCRS